MAGGFDRLNRLAGEAPECVDGSGGFDGLSHLAGEDPELVEGSGHQQKMDATEVASISRSGSSQPFLGANCSMIALATSCIVRRRSIDAF